MHYYIAYQLPHLHYVDITLKVDNIQAHKTYLQLPAWRPGRYELGNFAKNIQRFTVENQQGKTLAFCKLTKDRWEVETENQDTILVKYNYYAAALDAGNSWLDEEQLYLNFVNCMLYVEDRLEEKCQVHLDVPDDYTIACGLPEVEKHILEAESFYQLADSPMIASNRLTHWQYAIDESTFHLWFMGECALEKEKVLSHFTAFTREQIRLLGKFSEEDYHFLFQILPTKFYHGVEHANSTVIALGPAEKVPADMYSDFIGVSSHELFHAWNIIRIRPAEMMPYDFTRENYFPTGFVAEGITTYYGDLFLVRSGVLSKSEYFVEFNKLLKRHFDNFGRFNHSLVDSSHDLWLDGYSAGIPGRKVSIYVKGALVSFILDLELRKVTEGKQSLDTFMQYLWENFGKKGIGYSLDDLKKIVQELSDNQITGYFEDFIYGKIPLEEKIDSELHAVGCTLQGQDPLTAAEKFFGFRVQEENGKFTVAIIFPQSPAEQHLAPNDELIAINGRKIDNNLYELMGHEPAVEVTFSRSQKIRTVRLENKGETYFKQYTIRQREEATTEEKTSFEQWLGCKW